MFISWRSVDRLCYKYIINWGWGGIAPPLYPAMVDGVVSLFCIGGMWLDLKMFCAPPYWLGRSIANIQKLNSFIALKEKASPPCTSVSL